MDVLRPVEVLRLLNGEDDEGKEVDCIERDRLDEYFDRSRDPRPALPSDVEHVSVRLSLY